MSLDLHRVRLLYELHRRGTVTAVAKALSFSPSAVSQQLATLERETGVRLLEPVGRRVRLTAQGEVLVAHAGSLLAEVERAEAALAESIGRVAGTLRVAAFQSAVMSVVPAVLEWLASAHPDLRVEVTEIEPDLGLPAMVAGEYDLVIAEEYPHQPLPQLARVERHDVMSDELVLAAPDSWTVRSLRGAKDRPFVMEPGDSPAGQWALAACRDAGFEPDVRFTTTDLALHLRLVEARLAVALVPELAGAGSRPSIGVHRLPARPRRRVFVAVRRGASQHPAHRAFIDAWGEATGSDGGR